MADPVPSSCWFLFPILRGISIVITSLHHMDLYRLQGGADLRVLDIPGVLETSVCLIEWPDRLGAARPENRLGEKLDFTIALEILR